MEDVRIMDVADADMMIDFVDLQILPKASNTPL